MFGLNNKQTISQWYEIYANDIYRFLVYFIGTMVDVEDLLQDTFTRAYSGYQNFRGDASPKVWLLHIARNIAVDYVRKKGRNRTIDSAVKDNELPSLSTPEDQVVALETTRWLLKRISTKNPSFSQVLLVRGIEDLPSKDAAKVLGWSVNKVNVTYHRAIQAAREIMLESQQEEGTENR